jgi:DNA-binding PadR family transcriptional regulator
MKDLAQNTGGRMILLPGALYRRLQHLLDQGLIEEIGDADGGESRRRTFAITDFGKAVAEAEADRLASLVEAARLRHLVKRRAEAES